MTISSIQVPAHPYKMWVPLEKVIALRSRRNYTEFILTDGPKLLFTKTLKTVSEGLDSHRFFRVNRGCIINLQHIVKCESTSDGLVLHLINGETENISRRRKMDFLDIKLRPNLST
jgi:two-component system LytT family response regulator